MMAPPLQRTKVLGPTTDQTAEGEWVRRAAQGERWAQERLFRSCVQLVAQVARSSGARSADVEDIVQDTFIQALRLLNSLKSVDAFRSWISRLTIRQVQRRQRWRPWLTLFGNSDDEQTAVEGVVDPSVGPEEIARIREFEAVLNRLPREERLAWVLRHSEGFKLEEIAQACAVSLATVKRKLARAEAAIASWKGEAD